MAKRTVGKPRGILRTPPIEGRFAHEQHAPSEDLAPFVEHFWFVSWAVPTPVVREVLPHPSVHVTIEGDRSAVTGVPLGRFVTTLEGSGFVFGTKFRPGGFRPFVSASISELTNRTVPLEDVFGDAHRAYEAAVRDARSVGAMISAASSFFRARAPVADPRVAEVGAIVDRILADTAIVSVEDVARLVGSSARALQRLFKEYGGVSPKWVIRRYRLLVALERVNAGRVVDWAALAIELGWFDQPHFIRDFKALVGRTPSEYARGFRARSRSI